MLRKNKIKSFTDKHPFLGPIYWILCFQYFIVQLFVAIRWQYNYNILHNSISDLGNSSCGIYSDRYICSPLYVLMNISFILLGLFMMTGSIFIYQKFKKTKLNLIGFSFIFLAGLGSILVGLFPENTVSIMHLTGAFLSFFIGNIGILIIGIKLEQSKKLRIYTILTGVITLIALMLYVTHHYLGIYSGGMERITAYPQTIWLIVVGIYLVDLCVSKEPIN